MTVQHIGERWFTRQRMDDAVTLLVEQFTDPLIRCNIWHVPCAMCGAGTMIW